MAEQLINEFTVNRPIEEAWPIICDVERIAPCLPGAQLQEIVETDDGEKYRGAVKVKLGAIATEFKGEAHFVERNDTDHTARLVGSGRDTKGRGNAKADIAASAQSLSPTSTKVIVTTDLNITGKVAQFGRGILADVSGKLIDQFAQNLNEMIDADGVGSSATDASTSAATHDGSPTDSAGTDGAATDPSSTDPSSTEVSATAGAATDAPAAETARSDDSTPSGSRVRKIEGPANEPIDLMEFGGSSIAKRAAPVLIAVLLLLLFLRRRR